MPKQIPNYGARIFLAQRWTQRRGCALGKKARAFIGSHKMPEGPRAGME